MTRSWRLIRSGVLPGALNMALDEVLLEEVAASRSRPVLRLYRWALPTVSLGYAQSTTDVDLVACRELGLDLVRRPTGGRAVLHDQEATYAVIAPEHCPLFPARVLESYQVIARALQQAIGDLGLAAELVPGRRRSAPEPGNGICFAAPSSWELVFAGCKVAGSAQKRVGGAFLQHGSIPVQMDLEQLRRALHSPRRGKAEFPAAMLARQVGWLNRWLARPVTIEQVEASLVAAFAGELSLKFLPQEPTAAEWDRARELVRQKYGNPEWTAKPFPGFQVSAT